MPQLAKGGKWVFGWVVVNSDRTIQIPLDAWMEYSFEEDAEAVVLRGSDTSGGMAIGLASRLPDVLSSRIVGHGIFASARTALIPEAIDVHPGQKLLAVRGSGHALGFLTRGRIYELALTHPAMNDRVD